MKVRLRCALAWLPSSMITSKGPCSATRASSTPGSACEPCTTVTDEGRSSRFSCTSSPTTRALGKSVGPHPQRRAATGRVAVAADADLQHPCGRLPQRTEVAVVVLEVAVGQLVGPVPLPQPRRATPSRPGDPTRPPLGTRGSAVGRGPEGHVAHAVATELPGEPERQRRRLDDDDLARCRGADGEPLVPVGREPRPPRGRRRSSPSRAPRSSAPTRSVPLAGLQGRSSPRGSASADPDLVGKGSVQLASSDSMRIPVVIDDAAHLGGSERQRTGRTDSSSSGTQRLPRRRSPDISVVGHRAIAREVRAGRHRCRLASTWRPRRPRPRGRPPRSTEPARSPALASRAVHCTGRLGTEREEHEAEAEELVAGGVPIGLRGHLGAAVREPNRPHDVGRRPREEAGGGRSGPAAASRRRRPRNPTTSTTVTGKRPSDRCSNGARSISRAVCQASDAVGVTLVWKIDGWVRPKVTHQIPHRPQGASTATHRRSWRPRQRCCARHRRRRRPGHHPRRQGPGARQAASGRSARRPRFRRAAHRIPATSTR